MEKSWDGGFTIKNSLLSSQKPANFELSKSAVLGASVRTGKKLKKGARLFTVAEHGTHPKLASRGNGKEGDFPETRGRAQTEKSELLGSAEEAKKSEQEESEKLIEGKTIFTGQIFKIYDKK